MENSLLMDRTYDGRTFCNLADAPSPHSTPRLPAREMKGGRTISGKSHCKLFLLLFPAPSKRANFTRKLTLAELRELGSGTQQPTQIRSVLGAEDVESCAWEVRP